MYAYVCKYSICLCRYMSVCMALMGRRRNHSKLRCHPTCSFACSVSQQIIRIYKYTDICVYVPCVSLQQPTAGV